MWILCLNFWLLPHPGRKRCEEPQGCFLIRYELPWKHDLWNSYRAWCVVLSSSSWTSLQVRDKKKKAADPSSPWSFHSQVSFTVNTVLCVTAVDDDRIISGQLGCFRRTVELFLRRERWCEEILCSAVWWMKLVHECVKSLLSVQINFRSLSSRAGKKKIIHLPPTSQNLFINVRNRFQKGSRLQGSEAPGRSTFNSSCVSCCISAG